MGKIVQLAKFGSAAHAFGGKGQGNLIYRPTESTYAVCVLWGVP